MAQKNQREARYRWIGFSVAAVALLGWLLALYFWSVSAEARDELERQVALAGSAAELENRTVALQNEAARAETVRDQVVSNLSQLEQQLAQAQQAVAASEGRAQALRSEHEMLQEEIAVARDALAGQQEEAAQTRQEITERTQELSGVGGRLEEARRQEAESQSRLSELSTKLAELTAEAAGAEERVQRAREAEASLEQQVALARQELLSIQSTRDTVLQSVAALDQRREELASDSVVAEEQMQTMQELMVELSQTLAERSDRVAELQARIADLQQEAGRPARGASAGLVVNELYMHDAVTARFDQGGTFQMVNIESGDTVAGEYSVSEGLLTLSRPEGDLPNIQFPLRCGITAEGAGFKLEDSDGSCALLSGISFQRVGP